MRKLIFVFVTATLLFCLATARAESIEKTLKSELKKKVVILRGFYAGSELRFDHDGNLVGTARPGYWASDGLIYISEIKHDKQGVLHVEGIRMVAKYDEDKCEFVKYKSQAVSIDVETDSSLREAAAAKALMDKIVVRDLGELKHLVPDYWQSWFAVTRKRVELNGHWHCQRSEPQAVGGQIPATGVAQKDSPKPCQVPSLKPPKPLQAPDPEYSEAGRIAEMQGTTELRIVVDERGSPRSVEILNAIGGGLDDKAVEAVRSWRFAPAMCDGVPVADPIWLQMQFRLYR